MLAVHVQRPADLVREVGDVELEAGAPDDGVEGLGDSVGEGDPLAVDPLHPRPRPDAPLGQQAQEVLAERRPSLARIVRRRRGAMAGRIAAVPEEPGLQPPCELVGRQGLAGVGAIAAEAAVDRHPARDLRDDITLAPAG